MCLSFSVLNEGQMSWLLAELCDNIQHKYTSVKSMVSPAFSSSHGSGYPDIMSVLPATDDIVN